METWSERKWWHIVINYISGFAPLAIVSIIYYVLLQYESARTVIVAILVLFFIASFAYAVVSFLSLEIFDSKNGALGSDYLVALIEKNCNEVLGYYQTVALKPLPFRSRYRAKIYLSRYNFKCNFLPITKNPRVVSLTLNIVARLGEKKLSEKDFLSYINASASGLYGVYQTRFQGRAFNLIQHKIPQDVVEEINPFERASIDKFRDFLARELDPLISPLQITEVQVSL